MVASGCLPACPIVGQCPQSLEISQWLPQAVFLHALLRASVLNGIEISQSLAQAVSLHAPLRASVHITRDQSMDVSGCLPVCPIEGQCPISLEISQWLPLVVSLHGPLRVSVQITRDQSMVASSCLPAWPIEGQCPNHSRSINGCLRLSPCMPH